MDMTTWIDTRAGLFSGLSDKIWDFSELGYAENLSSSLLSNTLEGAGFRVERGLAGIPTAFRASFGSAKPVIAILGEFDALPGLSQEKVPYYKPREDGANGHGCGHNLLGVGSLIASMAVKEAIEAGDFVGTIQYYGCPAEETGAGKGFMVRAGAFEDVDLCLTWHPDTSNGVLTVNTLAVIMVRFRFHGRAAHAAYDPYNGRSALDAVELMNVGANYLREHIIPDGRLHYVITNGGGSAPNVVPALAESRYYIRAPQMHQAEQIYERLIDVAKGAALMTGTEMKITDKRGMSNLILNPTINRILHEKMIEVTTPQFNQEEVEFAGKIAATFSAEEAAEILPKMYGKEAKELLIDGKDTVLFTSVLPNVGSDFIVPGSTDVGDVSWVVPTGQFNATCLAFGTPNHSWQTVAQAGMGLGHKGMIYAGKVLALAASDFFSKPERVAEATEEFVNQIKRTPYLSPIAADLLKPF